MGVDFNFPGLLDRVWHHVVFHELVTDLLGAVAVAGNEVESITFTTVVLNSAQPKVLSLLFHKLISHGRVWQLKFLVLVVRGNHFGCEPDVVQVDLCNGRLDVQQLDLGLWLAAQQLVDGFFQF